MALDSNILAKGIEDNLDALSQAAGKGALPDLGKADREMLFSAIAQAIVDHITADAVVEVSDINLWQDPATGVIK
jgi:hypothetical protein